MTISGYLGSLELEQFLSDNHFSSISPIIMSDTGPRDKHLTDISTTVNHSGMTI